MTDPKDTPILDDIVKRGDEDLIKAARLEREIFDELNRMAPRDTPAPTRAEAEATDANPASPIEHEVERIVRHHSDAMRRELLTLLRQRGD
ncbi:MAG: hypothetical protein AAGA11_16120 [Pseudomonadota bacterium]